MNKSKFAAVLVGLTIGAPALADNQGFYIGVHMGKSESKESACIDTTIQCDRKDTAWTGNAGWMFTPNWGAEVAYNNLGRVMDQNDNAGRESFVRVRAISVQAVASVPIEKVSLYVKAGGYRAKTDLTSSYLAEGSAKNNQWVYGLGVRYDILSHLALRAEWQRFNNVGGAGTNFRADVDLLTGGVLLTF